MRVLTFENMAINLSAAAFESLAQGGRVMKVLLDCAAGGPA